MIFFLAASEICCVGIFYLNSQWKREGRSNSVFGLKVVWQQYADFNCWFKLMKIRVSQILTHFCFYSDPFLWHICQSKENCSSFIELLHVFQYFCWFNFKNTAILKIYNESRAHKLFISLFFSLHANNIEANIIEYIRWTIYSTSSSIRFLFTQISRRLYNVTTWKSVGAQLSTTQVVMFKILPIACFIFSLYLFSLILSRIHSHFGSVVVTVK